MVEIFKTNVKNKKQAGKVLKTLSNRLPAYLFNFDLDDCDRILRVKSAGPPIETVSVIKLVKDQQVEIILLND
jgi:hypothetical protein